MAEFVDNINERVDREERMVRAIMQMLWRTPSARFTKYNIRNCISRILLQYTSVLLLRCSICGEWLDPSKFPRHSTSKRGYRSSCSACDKLKRQARYWADPEKFRARARRQQGAKRRAAGIPERPRARARSL